MVIAMLLAHLMGDFVLQWDDLARRKNCEWRGVFIHGLIVFVVTAALALPFDRRWWPAGRGGFILLIGLSHLAVDAFWFARKTSLPPLARFLLDQALHIGFILLALVLGGYLPAGHLVAGIVAAAQATPWLTKTLGYVFVTMPAWVALRFLICGLTGRGAPDFAAQPNKFVGIGERLVVMALALSGQLLFVPLVALPRLIDGRPRMTGGGDDDRIALIELILGVVLAAAVGWAIRAAL